MSTKGKVIKCRAAVSWEKDQPLVMEEIEVSPPKANEVRIKIIATGLCLTDVSGKRGILPFAKFPCVLGHEAAGVIESIGPGVTEFQEGDHVMPIFLAHCQQCAPCKSKDNNLCAKFMEPWYGNGTLSDGTTRMNCKGKAINHFLGTSTYSEYTVVDVCQVVKVDKNAPLDKISILSCGVSTGYGSPINICEVKPGSTCAVFGLGTVGLGAVMGCRNQGASRIFGIDINNEKKEISKVFGVTDFLNSREQSKPIQDVLNDLTNGGCDFTFECIGIPEVLDSAISSTRQGGGQSCVVGVPAFGKKVTFDPYTLLYGRIWTGGFYGGFKSKNDIPGLVDDYLKKKILLDEFITTTLPIEEVNKSMDLLQQGKILKAVLYFNPGFKI